MIIIRPIRPDEIPAARHVILKVAYNIFGWEGSFEDSLRHFEASGEFRDMDNVESLYFGNDGLFLVVLDGDTIIGSGAIRKLDANTCELKRMWLLEAYHGRKIGYQVFILLKEFAHKTGYKVMRLQTSPEQVRAISFYRKLGFYDIPCYNDQPEELSMELKVIE